MMNLMEKWLYSFYPRGTHFTTIDPMFLVNNYQRKFLIDSASRSLSITYITVLAAFSQITDTENFVTILVQLYRVLLISHTNFC